MWWLPCPGYAADDAWVQVTAEMVEVRCGGYHALAMPLMMRGYRSLQ